MSGWQFFLALLIFFVCCFLMLVIMIQRGRGSGLAGAFGGAGGSSAFGAKTGDVLTWVTVVIAFVFLLLTVVANFKFDESPQRVIAAQPAQVPELPDFSLDDLGGSTDIVLPPLGLPDAGPVTGSGAANEPVPASTAGEAEPQSVGNAPAKSEAGDDESSAVPTQPPSTQPPDGGEESAEKPGDSERED